MPSVLPKPGPIGLGKAPTAPSAPEMYDIVSPKAMRQQIFNNVLTAAQKLPARQNARHTLSLTDVDYDDEKEFDYDKQKEAILANKTLDRRLVGTWKLTDNATGKTLDQKRQTVARVPYMTERGTFIYNGVEYTVGNQMRLRPGVYTRVKQNEEIEAHANILPGKGISHRYQLDPAKGVFYVSVGQARIPLMPLLKAMGVRDKDFVQAWGDKLYQANASKPDQGAMNKLFDRVVGSRDKKISTDKALSVVKAFQGMEVDPEVMRETLGSGESSLNANTILGITKKLLAVSRGEQEVDDRDNLAYQNVLSSPELFAERLTKDYGRMQANLLHKSSFKGDLSSVPSGALTKQLDSVLLKSGLGQSLEEINAAEILDKLTRISSLGEGGIGSLEAIPAEARNVQPSHLGFIDPVRTPESLRSGVDVYLGGQVRKGSDGRIYVPMKNTRSGNVDYVSPQSLIGKTIAFPGELNSKFHIQRGWQQPKRVAAVSKGKLGYYNRKLIDYEIPNMEAAFSPLGNLIPMKSAMKPQRMAMASRMSTQALPLLNAEAPLVQGGTADNPDESFEERYGTHMGAVRAEKPGRVISSSAGRMKVKYDDGEVAEIPLHDNYPLNRKTLYSQTSVLKPGDTFGPKQLLARSNFTDEKGATALGLNMRVGYMPMHGYNFEDAFVLSQSAAKRLSSEHMYQHNVDITKDHQSGKNPFVGVFPGQYPKALLDKMDSDGVVKKGTIVNTDDPLILLMKRREVAQNKVHRGRGPTWGNASETWQHHSPGVVTDVYKSPKGATVVVKSIAEMEEGDKLSGRMGDKGVIAKIFPDEMMPKDEEGRPLEVVVNDLSLISRVNANQIVEAVLGKIAAKTGKPFKVQDFKDTDDLAAYAYDEMKKAKVKDLETIYDPQTGRHVPNVLVGNRFFMKLHHTAESKGQGRATGGYTSEDTPAKGGETGSKRIGLLESNALLAHGAYETLRDASVVRGQRNDEAWLAFMQGLPMPRPKVPYTYEKFVNSLRGSGINVTEDGPNINVMALTNKDVDQMTGDRYIENGDTVKFEKDMEPIKGGLFDPALTGGHDGNRWAAIKLPEPMPNPVMEEPIRRLLDLTKDKFEAVLAGEEQLSNYGTGPKAIQQALKGINIPKEIEYARQQIKSSRKTAREHAIRRLKYLKQSEKSGIHPQDYMLDKVPVLPPRFRRISVITDKKLPLIADANYLYKELLEARDNYNDMSGQVDDVTKERRALYSAFKAVTGLGDPIHPKLVEKNVSGLLKNVFGSSPKFSTVQHRMLGTTVDMVGRAVIAPDPDLDMDSVGIPEKKAWDVYRMFVIRRLRRRGMKLLDAVRNVNDQTDLAKRELVGEMQDRPVLLSRAPVLHKLGIMAFKPRLTKGDILRVSPLIVKGFNADFDGDAMQYHVPATDEARQEALERLLPSRNLLSSADFKTPVHAPMREYLTGLFQATAGRSKRKARQFLSVQDVMRAFERGDINADDEVTVPRLK